MLTPKTPIIEYLKGIIFLVTHLWFVWLILGALLIEAIPKWKMRRYDNMSIEVMVEQLSVFLDDNAAWQSPDQARPMFNNLKYRDPLQVTSALVMRVRNPDRRLQVLFLAVKLGIPDSERRLNEALLQYGDKRMAEDYLNSGSEALSEGGRRWAHINGYSVDTGHGSRRVIWDRFD